MAAHPVVTISGKVIFVMTFWGVEAQHSIVVNVKLVATVASDTVRYLSFEVMYVRANCGEM